MANVSNSGSTVENPFGNVPRQVFGQVFKQQLGPLLSGLGFGDNQGFEQRLNDPNNQGPLAEALRGVRSFAGSVIPQAQNIGNETAKQGRADAGAQRGQVSSALAALPGYQQAANSGLAGAQDALGHANQLADFAFSPQSQAIQKQAQAATEDTFSPVRQSALFQQTAQNVLNPARQGEAARGLESAGAGQQQEEKILQQLGGQYAANQGALQGQAIQNQGALQGQQINATGAQSQAGQGVGNAAGLAQGLSAAGVPLSQQYSNITNNLAQTLAQQYNMPLQAAGSLISLLTAGLTPGIQGTAATAPQLGSSSKGLGIL